MVSIVILTHNKLELTKECIESIYEFTDPSTFELVIIDNASTDATPPYLSKISHQYKNIKGIYNDQNISFARGCNQGAGVAEGDYLLFLNNDTRVTPNWLDEILLVFKNEEKAGIVGSRLLYPDGRLQHAGVVLTLWNGLPINIDVNVEGEVPRTLETRKVFAVTGACMLIRKNLFFDCKGFDEEYVYGYEDIDLCMKVREKGYNIFYVPKSLLY
ncbi:glycosyltransferase family 2 protein, partial [bacterium]|nr:glycosyltransferase family 2 protein [bacterium]MBU2461990.1 glycosyltransferase family 2 protein [bacterium]